MAIFTQGLTSVTSLSRLMFVMGCQRLRRRALFCPCVRSVVRDVRPVFAGAGRRRGVCRLAACEYGSYEAGVRVDLADAGRRLQYDPVGLV